MSIQTWGPSVWGAGPIRHSSANAGVAANAALAVRIARRLMPAPASAFPILINPLRAAIGCNSVPLYSPPANKPGDHHDIVTVRRGCRRAYHCACGTAIDRRRDFGLEHGGGASGAGVKGGYG